MKCELSHFVDLIAPLEQTTRRLVPQVMESQVDDAKDMAGPRKRRANASGLVGEDVFAGPGLALNNRPGFRCELESPVVAFLMSRMFSVAYQSRSAAWSLSAHSIRQISDSRRAE